MITRIRFEFNRIFSRKNIIILVIILICTLLLIGLGISDYKSRLELEENFKIAEGKKIKNFKLYEQYAAHGFRVCFKPSPMSVFFQKFNFTRSLEALINLFEDLNIYNKKKGGLSFSRFDTFSSLGNIIYLLYTLFFIYMGIITFRYKQETIFPGKQSFIKAVISRLLLLDITFSLLLAVFYLFPIIMGITFSFHETLVFAGFGIAAVFFLNLFFMLGVVIGAIFKYRKKALSYFPAVWFTLFLILPVITQIIISKDASFLPSPDDLDLKKQASLLNAEKNGRDYVKKILETNKDSEKEKLKKILRQLAADFLKNGYQENRRLESEFHSRVEELIDGIERISFLIPTDFFRFACCEISGSGYREYLNFINYVLDLEQEFLEFYFDRRDSANKGEIENFIKNDENIYKAQSRLPQTFWKGTGVILLYTVVLFLLFLRLNRRKDEKIEKLGIQEMPDPKDFLFLLTDSEKKDNLLKVLTKGDDVALMEIPPEEVFKEDVSIKRYINYVCRAHKVDKKKLTAYLQHLGILKEDFNKRLSKLSVENMRKIACSVALARNKKTLIIDSFLKDASVKFEKKFLELIEHYLSEGKKVAYVSEKIFLPAASTKIFTVGEKGYFPYVVSPKNVSLR